MTFCTLPSDQAAAASEQPPPPPPTVTDPLSSVRMAFDFVAPAAIETKEPLSHGGSIAVDDISGESSASVGSMAAAAVVPSSSNERRIDASSSSSTISNMTLPLLSHSGQLPHGLETLAPTTTLVAPHQLSTTASPGLVADSDDEREGFDDDASRSANGSAVPKSARRASTSLTARGKRKASVVKAEEDDANGENMSVDGGNDSDRSGGSKATSVSPKSSIEVVARCSAY